MKKILMALSVALSGFLVYIIDKIWGDSIVWENIKSTNIKALFTYEISIFHLLLFLLLFLLIWRVGYLFFKKNQYSKKQRKLREYNTFEKFEDGLLFKWDVNFEDETPYIKKLTPYSTKHPFPLRFMNDKCPDQNCINSKINFDRFETKNGIESVLINEWERIY